MDSLANQLSNVSLYDVKASFRKAQNAVLNFSDMEAKVREATNNEPWGTPSSVMQQIAEGTSNYQQFHEIMPFVYRRFTEKSAHSWRQIYKSLQLLEYLVKNGSERVVDYARSHIAVVELLRHFSYIDSKGVDQGESIRRRSDELVKLLNNTDLLRSERKKAKQLNAKTMTSSAGSASNPSFNSPGSGFGGSGRKYGGFSSETYRSMKYGGAPTQQVFGDGGGFDGSNHIVSGRNYESEDFEEYVVDTNSTNRKDRKAAKPAEPSVPEPEEEEDDDDEFAEFEAATVAPAKPSTNAGILDLFSAPATTTFTSATASNNTLDLFSVQQSAFSSPAPSTPAAQPLVSAPAAQIPASSTPASTTQKPAVDLFGSLWESSKAPAQKSNTESLKPAQPAAAPAPAAAAAAPAAPASTPAQPAQPAQSDALVDLLSF